MAVMKMFCGCMGTKSGSLLMISLYVLVYIAEIVVLSIRLARGTEYGWFEEEVADLEVCTQGRGVISAGEFAGTLWCQGLERFIEVEFYFSLIKICLNAALMVCSGIAIVATILDRHKLLLPYLILEASQMFLFFVSGIVTVVHLAVYRPRDIEIITIICVGIIFIIILVPAVYLWLCPFSLYQTLRDIQALQSDKIKILKDTKNYPGADPGYDPHSDDYPVEEEEEEAEGEQEPPSYRASSSPRPREEEAKVEDLGD